MEEVQAALSKLIELAHAERDAVRREDRERMDSIDAEIEHALGAKEQALGALKEHRQEHGC